MSQSKMLIPASLPGVQIPEGYMLVTQAKPTLNRASNSAPQPAYGRNWNRNQRKRERREKFLANGAGEPSRNSGPATPPDTVEVGIVPVVAQPMGSLTDSSCAPDPPKKETSPGSPRVTSPAPYDPSDPTSTTPGSSCCTENETSPGSSPPPSPDPLDPPSNKQTPNSPAETEVVNTEPPSSPPPKPDKFLEPVWSPSDDESIPSFPYYANALSGEDLDEERYQRVASYQRFTTVRTPLPKEAQLGLWLGGGPPFFRKFFIITKGFF